MKKFSLMEDFGWIGVSEYKCFLAILAFFVVARYIETPVEML